MRFSFIRKPAPKWGNKINYIVMVLLFGAAICGMVTGITSQVIFFSYKEYNLFRATPVFIAHNSTAGNSFLSEFFTTTQSTTTIKSSPTPSTTIATSWDDTAASTRKPTKLTHIYKDFMDDEEEDNSTFLIEEKSGVIHIDNEADFNYLTSVKLDYMNTIWGSLSLREYIIFYPFTMAIAAVIWSSLLFVFRTGPLNTWGLPRPWRIVLPSIIFLILMVISTLTYVIIVNSGYNHFCNCIRTNLINKETPCIILVTIFRESTTYSFKSFDYITDAFFISQRCALVLWIIACLIMILRCVFVIDFQITHVTIVTASEVTETTELKTGAGTLTTAAVGKQSIDPMSSATEIQLLSLASTSPPDGPEDEEFYSAHSLLDTMSIKDETAMTSAVDDSGVDEHQLQQKSSQLHPLIREKGTKVIGEDFV